MIGSVNNHSLRMTSRFRRKCIWWTFSIMGIITLMGIGYVKARPLVFSESLWSHAHCMPQASMALQNYAQDHDGRFPYHTNGWGNALLLAVPEPSWFYMINGPGYDNSAFEEALAAGGVVDVKRCGRVYVQGLSTNSNPKITIVFNKVAAPPDHCQFPRRLWAGFVREVCFVDGSWRPIPIAEWPAFARDQVDLLVASGFSRAPAQELYDQVR
jgi:hypothetical protein